MKEKIKRRQKEETKVIIILGGKINYCFLRNQLQEHPGAFIICTDHGADIIYRLNKKFRMSVLPDLLVGDLDSFPSETKAWLVSNRIQIKPKASQSLTDFEYALGEAYRYAPKKIFVYGGFNSRRFDLEASNIAVLELFLHGVADLRMKDEEKEVFLVDEKADIIGKTGDVISLLPVSRKVTGITTFGLKWQLNDATLYRCKSRAVSNVLLKDKAVIQVEGGGVLKVIHLRKNKYVYEAHKGV